MKSVVQNSSRSVFLTFVLSVLLAVVFMAANYAVCYASNLTLDYRSGKLSADISKVPIQKVLRELSKKSNITVFIDTSLKSKKISAQFKNLSLERGIKKLVKPFSSAIVYKQRITPDGRKKLYVSEVKVFDSSNQKATFELVGGKKMSGTESITPTSGRKNWLSQRAIRVTLPPPEIREPARAAASSKRVSAYVLRTRLTQKMAEIRRLKQRMNREEQQKINNLERLKRQLSTASESEKMKIQSRMSLLSLDLNNSRKRYDRDLKRLQRGLDQLKNRLILQEGSLAKNDERVPAQK